MLKTKKGKLYKSKRGIVYKI